MYMCNCEEVESIYGDSYGEYCLVCGGVIKSIEDIEREYWEDGKKYWKEYQQYIDKPY